MYVAAAQKPFEERGVFPALYRIIWNTITEYSKLQLSGLHILDIALKDAHNTKSFWSPDCDEAFNLLKQAFISAPVLHHFDPALPPIVKTDASDYAITGMFSLQTDDGEIHPVVFYACTLLGTEQMYNGMNPLELNQITTYFDEVKPHAGIPARYVPQSTLS